MMRGSGWLGVLLLLGLCAGVPRLADAEAIKIGVLKTSGSGPVYLAQERGYFTAEGLAAQIIFFDAGIAIPAAVVSGDIDFGVTGINAGLYNMAGQGAIRIIASQARETPGFPNNTVVASNKAWDAGLKTWKDIAGRTFSIGAVGTPPHYSLVLIAEKYGVDLNTVRVVQLGAVANSVSAIVGGQADVSVIPVTYIMPSIQRGDARLMGYVGDEVFYQFGAAFTAAKTTNERRETVEHFLRAYRKATREYHDAFTGADGKLAFGPGAPAIMAIIAKNTGQPVEQIKLGISFVDADARIDVKDIQHQIDWFKAQGMVKGDVDAKTAVDMRYATALPEK
jgi:NitT/TauT family transport system substrate-binding protein